MEGGERGGDFPFRNPKYAIKERSGERKPERGEGEGRKRRERRRGEEGREGR